jgi:arylsulfatase A-like enzyme
LAATPTAALAQDTKPRPNFIVLLVDDWGMTDGGAFGSDLYETPHIDRLTADGVYFTNAYAACTVCSPTRAAMMTGQYPGRTNVTDFIPGKRIENTPVLLPDWTQRLEHRHVTIAEALKPYGYKTASIGKWHLTPRSEAPAVTEPYHPERHGFDINVAGNQWGAPPGGYFLPNRLDLPGADKGEYLTHELTDRALAILDDWKDRPFFIYFPYYNVHTPIQAPADRAAYYEKRVRPGMTHVDPKFAAMVEAVDQSVGRLRARLEELGIADRTTIILTGDNGGLDRDGRPTDNAPLREGKGSSYEGGVRVPGVVYAPGVSKPGVSHEPIITVDVFPTVLDLAGVTPPAAVTDVLDGLSLRPLLGDHAARLDRDDIYFHYPHYHSEGAVPHSAIRARDWKLIHFLDDNHVELYNLKEDLSEKRDLSTAEPGKVAELLGRLDAWRRSVNAQMPPANPDYDPAKPSVVSNRGGVTPARAIDEARLNHR